MRNIQENVFCGFFSYQLSQRKTKQKSKKRFVGVTEKYLKIQESLSIYDGKLFERN